MFQAFLLPGNMTVAECWERVLEDSKSGYQSVVKYYIFCNFVKKNGLFNCFE